MRIAILDDYQNVSKSLADWSALDGKADIDVYAEPLGDEDAVAGALGAYNAIVCMRERTPFPASLIARLDNLQLIITTGMRNRSIDMEAARARGVTVCGAPGQGESASELTWALIMAVMKNIPADVLSMRNGEWQPNVGRELGGKTLATLGLGHIGGNVARYAQAFDMNVIAWSENLTDARAEEVGVRRVTKEEALAQADILTIHLISSDRTRGLIGAPELATMKPTAFLINTSRGPIVEEAALIDALQGNRIAGAGIDVYDVEPLPATHPLRALKNTVLSPHTGYVTAENLSVMYQNTVENIAAFIADDPIRVIN